MTEKRQEFNRFVGQAQKIAIVAHAGLDDDAIASCLAVYAYLKHHFPNKELHIYNESSPYTERDWMPNADRIEYLDDISDKLNQADLVIFLDCQTVSRVTDHHASVNLNNFRSIRIDHHPDEPDDFDLDFSDLSAVATCQIIADVIFDDDVDITPTVAETLMVGILGDSGTFRYVRPGVESVLSTAERLVGLGSVDISLVELKISQIKKPVWGLLRTLFDNTTLVKLSAAPDLAYTYLPKSFRKNFSEDEIGAACGQYHYLITRKIEGYPWGFTVSMKTPGRFKVSLRSITGAPDVSQIAKLLGGGGHARAAGAKIKVSDPKFDSPDIVEKVLQTIRQTELEIIE